MRSLVDLIDEHRGAIEYDWRRLGTSVDELGEGLSWGEGLRLVKRLATDPASHLGAALAGWDYPASREAIAAWDLFDLTHQIAWVQGGKKGPRPKPYPRPWPDRTKTRPKPSVPREVVIAALRRSGHTGPLPAWATATSGAGSSA